MGAALPPPTPAAAEPVTAGRLFWKTSPRRRDCAGAGPRPARRRGTTMAQRIRRYTPGGPSTHARAHTVPHTGTRWAAPGQAQSPPRTRDGRRQRAATDARPRTHSPSHSQTRKHAPRARQGPPGTAPAPCAQVALPGGAPTPLGAAPSAPCACSAPGPLRRDGPGPRRFRAASSRGHAGPGEGDEHHPPPATLHLLSLCPAPFPRPQANPAPPETPPLAANSPGRRNPTSFSGDHAPQLTTPQVIRSPARHCLRNSLALLRWFGDSSVVYKTPPPVWAPRPRPHIWGLPGSPGDLGAPSPTLGWGLSTYLLRHRLPPEGSCGISGGD